MSVPKVMAFSEISDVIILKLGFKRRILIPNVLNSLYQADLLSEIF